MPDEPTPPPGTPASAGVPNPTPTIHTSGQLTAEQWDRLGEWAWAARPRGRHRWLLGPLTCLLLYLFIAALTSPRQAGLLTVLVAVCSIWGLRQQRSRLRASLRQPALLDRTLHTRFDPAGVTLGESGDPDADPHWSLHIAWTIAQLDRVDDLLRLRFPNGVVAMRPVVFFADPSDIEQAERWAAPPIPRLLDADIGDRPLRFEAAPTTSQQARLYAAHHPALRGSVRALAVIVSIPLASFLAVALAYAPDLRSSFEMWLILAGLLAVSLAFTFWRQTRAMLHRLHWHRRTPEPLIAMVGSAGFTLATPTASFAAAWASTKATVSQEGILIPILLHDTIAACPPESFADDEQARTVIDRVYRITGRCPRCDYPFHDTESPTCVECGEPITPPDRATFKPVDPN